MLSPTDPSVYHYEEGTYPDVKYKWLDKIHQCSDSTDWRLIERQNTLASYKRNYQESELKKDKIVTLGESGLAAKWQEKGSSNQAGSVHKTNYDRTTHTLYAIADGGSLWRTNLDLFDWELVDDQIRFDTRFLGLAYRPDQQIRIITSVGGVPYFKDQNENHWSIAQGVNPDKRYEIKDQISDNNGQYIFYLAKDVTQPQVTLYYSSDYGSSYSILKEWQSERIEAYALEIEKNTNKVFLLETVGLINVRVTKFDFVTETFINPKTSNQIFYGNGSSSAPANLTVSNGVFQTLYTYDGNNILWRSNDEGGKWQIVSTMEVRPWDVGVYASKSDPNLLLYGAVELRRSESSGRTWSLVNEYYEYYGNEATKLHADIMYMDEYFIPHESRYVLVVSNHGGVSKSYNNGKDFVNMGLNKLYISQYYSVKTYPYNENYIFAGSQDQGLQSARDLNEGVMPFLQFTSGDFGHLQFTNLGKSLWAIYPGGLVHYFPDPLSSNRPVILDNPIRNNTVWIPPIIQSPYDPNSILMAGGSQFGNSGSYIIEITINDLSELIGNQWPYNFRNGGGDISALGYNRSDIDEFYVLTTNGKFYKSHTSRTDFRAEAEGLNDAHNLYGHSILTSTKTPDRIIIGGSGYDNPAVFISDNRGTSFSPMINGLPPTTVFQMVYDQEEKYIFAATEAGPYVYIIEDGRWQDLAEGIAPNQRYWSVEYLQSKNVIRFGTYGRGIWDLEIDNFNSTKGQNNNESPLVYPNPTLGDIVIKLPNPKGKLTILNTKGKILYSKDVKRVNKDLEIDLKAFTKGLYYVIFESEGNITSSKVIKL